MNTNSLSKAIGFSAPHHKSVWNSTRGMNSILLKDIISFALLMILMEVNCYKISIKCLVGLRSEQISQVVELMVTGWNIFVYRPGLM